MARVQDLGRSELSGAEGGAPRPKRIPPNVLRIQEVLGERGPLTLSELRGELAEQRVLFGDDDRLARVIDRFSDLLTVDGHGRVALVVPGAKAGGSPSVPTGVGSSDRVGSDASESTVRALPPDAAEHHSDPANEAVGSRSDGGTASSWRRWKPMATVPIADAVHVALIEPDGPASEPTGVQVLEPGGRITTWEAGSDPDGLVRLLDPKRRIIVHRAAPLRRALARWTRGASLDADAVVLAEVVRLALLVEPGLDGDSLEALSEHLGTEQGPEGSPARVPVEQLAAITEGLIAHVDPDEPNWALVLRVLARGDDPWSGLLPPPGPLDELSAALEPFDDPLVRPGAERSRAEPMRVGVAADLESHGETIEGYRSRPGQIEMAREVGDALEESGRLLIEAPTGTGKSLAYLIPAIRQSPKTPVVIATHTKVLQRQLHHEASELRSSGILDVPFRQIQGLENHLCPRNMAGVIEAEEATSWFGLAVAIRALPMLRSGTWDDLADWSVGRDDLRYRRQRASLRVTNGTCERHSCVFVDRCPFHRRLEDVDQNPGIISTNHALLARWASAIEEGGSVPGRLFDPRPTAVVVDEAHNLEDSLTSAWAGSVSGIDLVVLVTRVFGRDGVLRQARRASVDGGVDRSLVESVAGLEGAVREAVEELGEAVATYVHEFGGGARALELLPRLIGSRPQWQAVRQAIVALRARLGMLQGALISLSSGVPGERSVLKRQLEGVLEDLGSHRGTLGLWSELDLSHAFVHELSAEDPDEGGDPETEWTYRRLPVEVAPLVQTRLLPVCRSLVLTSATLRVAEDFGFIRGRLGLDDPEVRTVAVPSPFDHDEQSAVVLTSHLPLPLPSSESEFCESFGDDQIGFLSLSGGRALSLFAARRRMEQVAARVRGHRNQLRERGVELLVQGEDTPARIQDRFRGEPGTVVYGLRSYWEGFDAPGEALSYLFIEKAPYPHPDAVLEKARQRRIQERGGDSFNDYVVPRTAIALTQGFGRLIRRETDRGVALIADRRLQQPSPANVRLLDSLPTRTQHLAIDRDDAWRWAIEFVTGEEPDLTQALLGAGDELTALLERLRLEPGEDPEAKLREAALLLFGIEELRAEQIEIMAALLAGRDVMGFLPTGSGKSLTFQLPALLHPQQLPTVVVSPLVALIKDQIDELRGRRGLRAVMGITARTTVAERTETLRDLASGTVRLLYVSPERLVRDPTLRSTLARSELGALVVDEAHCVSSWGHDFRPEFRQIAPAVTSFRRSPRLALTATATRDVEADITETLELTDPLVVRRPVDRPELTYWVRPVADDLERTRELLRFVAHMGGAPGIVYASRRALTEELAWILRESGVTARSYHGGMEPPQREAVQEDFLAGVTQIIVATKAFGMGVNKPDIGWVLHFDLPESLEAYAQEAGRAARRPDLTGMCVLLWSASDVARRRRHLRRDAARDHHGLALRLLRELDGEEVRGGDTIVDPEDLADRLGITPDELNVLVAWLERAGALTRGHDSSFSGRVSIGSREPADPDERRRFVKILHHQLRCIRGVSRDIVIGEVADEAGVDPDVLEDDLIGWSLDRLITFNVHRRRWRLRRMGDLDRSRLRRVVDSWLRGERGRLEAMIDYAEQRGCRRTAILRAFGDADSSCDDGGLPCDVHAGGSPPWHAVPVEAVLDPEKIVDVPLVVLQAVRWASGFSGGRYGLTGLRAALCGTEVLGGRHLGRGLMSCPQFGALRYLRANERRFDAAFDELAAAGLVGETSGSYQGRSYRSPIVTDAGIAFLEGRA